MPQSTVIGILLWRCAGSTSWYLVLPWMLQSVDQMPALDTQPAPACEGCMAASPDSPETRRMHRALERPTASDKQRTVTASHHYCCQSEIYAVWTQRWIIRHVKQVHRPKEAPQEGDPRVACGVLLMGSPPRPHVTRKCRRASWAFWPGNSKFTASINQSKSENSLHTKYNDSIV